MITNTTYIVLSLRAPATLAYIVRETISLTFLGIHFERFFKGIHNERLFAHY